MPDRNHPNRRGPSPAPARRVLISGGAGFIGAALACELLARGLEVVCVDDLSAGRRERLPEQAELVFRKLDVARPGGWRELLASQPPCDAIFHLAARVGVRAVLRDPAECRRINEQSVRELVLALEQLPAGRRPRVLAASSSEVYAESREPLHEGSSLRDAADGRWAYAASKLAGERILDRVRGLWMPGRGAVHLRFFNVVGPGQDSHGGMVLSTFVERALAGAPIPVHGDGRQLRTFAHVREVARVLADLVGGGIDWPAGALNVGGRACTRIDELARCVARLAGGASIERVDPRVVCAGDFEEVHWRQPDLSRLDALGVATPSMSLDEIVASTLAEHEPSKPRSLASARRVACASPAS